MNKKVKILFLDHTPFVGGAQLSLIEHLRNIDFDKFEIVIACSKQAELLGLTDEYKKIGLKYYFIPFEKLKKIKFSVFFELFTSIKVTIAIIKKEKIDIVFGNTVRADIVASLAGVITRKKIIWFIQDVTFPTILFKFMLVFTNQILYVSKYVADFYSVKIGEKNKVIYIWRDEIEIDEESFQKIKKGKRDKWGVNDGDIVVGGVGRLVKDKGVQVLINAVKILLYEKNIDNNLKCVIIGSGSNQEDDFESSLKNLIASNGLEKYFVFEGYKKEVFFDIKSFDIFCQTSIAPEGLPTVILESMLAKTPVIASDVGGTREVLMNNKNGLSVKPNNARQLSDAIKKLLSDEDLKNKLSKNAYFLVKNNFSSFKKTKEIEKIYLDVINNIKTK